MLPVRTLLFGWSHIFTHLDDGAQLYSGQNLLGFQVMARCQSMWLEVWGTDSLTHRGSFPALLVIPALLLFTGCASAQHPHGVFTESLVALRSDLGTTRNLLCFP